MRSKEYQSSNRGSQDHMFDLYCPVCSPLGRFGQLVQLTAPHPFLPPASLPDDQLHPEIVNGRYHDQLVFSKNNLKKCTNINFNQYKHTAIDSALKSVLILFFSLAFLKVSYLDFISPADSRTTYIVNHLSSHK